MGDNADKGDTGLFIALFMNTAFVILID